MKKEWKNKQNVTAKTLKGAIQEMVNKDSTIMTDEWPAYNGTCDNFRGGHKVINHGEGQYVDGDGNTNTAESYFALLKRGVNGTFHHISISKKHLRRYCDEFSFRWNNRQVNDGDRAVEAIKRMVGKRLMYKKVIGQ